MEISVQEVQDRLARGEPLVLIDVREQNEWNLGHAASAEHVAGSAVESQIESRVARDATIVLYCATGSRSLQTAQTLLAMGYTNVSSMTGGFRDWIACGGEVVD